MAVVTGARRGLGCALTRRLLDLGVHVGACARRAPLADQLAVAGGGDVLVAAVDVADAGAVEAFGQAVTDRFGRLDLWVNNAAVLEPVGPLADLEPGDLERHVAVNLLGVLHGSATFARHVRGRAGSGVLLNLSSGAARHPYRGWAPYCATKAAVEAATAVIAEEGRVYGLRAHAVAPGVVDTAMQEAVRSSAPERFPDVDRFARRHAEGSLSPPEWVADALVDLAFGPDPPQMVRLRVPDAPKAGGASGP